MLLSNITNIAPRNTTVDTFSGNGSQTVFTLSQNPGSKNNTLVNIYGVTQQKSTYSVSGTTITFTTAPPLGTSNIEVVSSCVTVGQVPADKSVDITKFADSALQLQADLTNLLYPSADGSYRDLARSGWLHAGMNQQWGGSQWGCEMVDGATGNLYKFDVATGNIEDNAGSTTASSAGNFYTTQGFITNEAITNPVIWVKLAKVGNPSNVAIALFADNGTGSPGTNLGIGTTITPRAITAKYDGEWVRFTLVGSLAANTKYHATIYTGYTDASNYIIWKYSNVRKYPFGYVNNGTSAPVWTPATGASMCFLLENPTSTRLLTTGGQFDGKLQFGADTYPSQIKALTQPMRNFFDGKEFTYAVRGTAFTKDKTIADFTYGLDHDRIVLRCNAITGYARVDVYDKAGTKRTVTGTTDVSTGFHDVSIHVRSKADGADKIELFVDGVSQGTPLTGLTLTFDPLMRDLGTAWVGGGFALAPTWTQKLDMFTLPSANGWTWTGTGTEAVCMSVSGGKLYQNKNGYGSSDTGYYVKSSVGFSNAAGWSIEWKGRIPSTTNTPATQTVFLNMVDGVKAIGLFMSEYFIQTGTGGIADFTFHGDFKSQENTFRLCGKGSDYYLYINGEIAIDGTGKLTTASASNLIGFGDANATASENADAIWDYVAYSTAGMMIPQATSGTLSEAAYWSGDKTSYLPTLYNAGTPISVKQFTGQSKNYVGEGVVQKEVRRGVTSSPTTTSAISVLLTDMECYAVGSELGISQSNVISGSVAGTGYYTNSVIDGVYLSNEVYQTASAGYQQSIGGNYKYKGSIGMHKVEVRMGSGSGTATSMTTMRNLTVEAKS